MIPDGAVQGAAAMKGDRLTRSFRIAVVVLVALGALSLSSVVLAQEDYPPTPPPDEEVLGDDEVKGGVVESTGNGGVLPFTGGQVILIVLAGAGLIVLGTMAYRRSRSEAGIN
jgi:hypothetical protein